MAYYGCPLFHKILPVAKVVLPPPKIGFIVAAGWREVVVVEKKSVGCFIYFRLICISKFVTADEEKNFVGVFKQ
jgi:hypothetical protein